MTATIVYDWNGTLFDDALLVAEGFNAVFERFGRARISLDRFRDTFDFPPDKFFFESGFEKEEVEKHFPVMMKMFSDFYEPLADKASLRNGAVDMLISLKDKGVKQILLSNHLADKIIKQLKRFGVYDFVDVVLAHPDIDSHAKKRKKEDFFKEYLKKNNIDLSKAITIGDSHEETLFAKRLGMVSVSITGGLLSEARLCAARPDHLIHSLTELEPILRERRLI